jgi:hypothetical protein
MTHVRKGSLQLDQFSHDMVRVECPHCGGAGS